MKRIYCVMLVLTLVLLLGVGVYSLVDRDVTISESEKAHFEMPTFSLEGLLDGSYISGLETYYAKTFPQREMLLSVNRWMNGFYYYSGAGEDTVLILDQTGGAEQGGESLEAVEQMLAQTQKETVPEPEVIAEEPPAEEIPAEPEEPVEEPAEEQPPELDNPAEEEASYAGSVVLVGDRAMEIPTATDSIILDYAAAINNLSNALGSDVRVISLLTPNGGQFYSPESLHTGLHDQKEMIDLCYGAMDENIVTVDAYSALRNHTDEYIYFRTDHHWTQLGAYYAYTAYCKATGLTAVDLDEFQTGRYENFLGSMYTFTSGYSQSDILKANPDYLDYYLPIVETHAKNYADSTLTNGTSISVVYQSLQENVTNKYLCYIGGDNPICIIQTNTDGPVCMVLKESYGNAFVPFLTSHYSKIVVIDPREFNQDGKPSLDLKDFALQQGVDDLLVINYPYMINSKPYIRWLNALVGTKS